MFTWIETKSESDKDGVVKYHYKVQMDGKLIAKVTITHSAGAWYNGNGVPYSGRRIAQEAWQFFWEQQ